MFKRRTSYRSFWIVSFLILTFVFICWKYWKDIPGRTIRDIFTHYQREYPDIKFSFQDYNTFFDGEYHVEIKDLILAKENRGILKLDKIVLSFPFSNLWHSRDLVKVKLNRVYSDLEIKTLLWEKEFNQSFKALIQSYFLDISWEKIELTHEISKSIITEGRIISEESEDKQVEIKSRFKFEGEKLSFFVNSNINGSHWLDNGDIIGTHVLSFQHLDLNVLCFRHDIGSWEFKTLLDNDGFLKWEGKSLDSAITGELLGEINEKGFDFSVVNNLIMSTSILDEKEKGEKYYLDVNDAQFVLTGHYRYLSLNGQVDSSLKFELQNAFVKNEEDKKKLSLSGDIKENILYQIKVPYQGMLVQGSGIGDIAGRGNSLNLTLTKTIGNEVNKNEVKKLIKEIGQLKNIFFKLKVDDFYFEKNKKMRGEISFARDEEMGEKLILSLSGSLLNSYLRGEFFRGTKGFDCDFNMNNILIENYSWLTDEKDFSELSGKVSGSFKCAEGKVDITLNSNSLYAPLFSINDNIKKSYPRFKFYQDRYFAEFESSWINGKLSSVFLKNRGYEIKGDKKESGLFVLSLKDRKLSYIREDGEWKFIEVK